MLFYYKIKYFDEISGAQREDSGIVNGETYGKALDAVAGYYGEDNICDVESFYVYEINELVTKEEIKESFWKE